VKRQAIPIRRFLVMSAALHALGGVSLMFLSIQRLRVDALVDSDQASTMDVELASSGRIEAGPGEKALSVRSSPSRTEGGARRPASPARAHRARRGPGLRRAAGPDRSSSEGDGAPLQQSAAGDRSLGEQRSGSADYPSAGDAGSGLTCMRNCDGQPGRDRFGSFWSGPRPVRDGPTAPVVVSRLESNGVALTEYEDGGRLLSRSADSTWTGGRPDLGTIGLIELAGRSLGGSSGRVACNPYRDGRLGRKTLVLLVDSSASISSFGRAHQAAICAAGAALAALERGLTVEVLNFSSTTLHQPPTREAEPIYNMLLARQHERTLLPAASQMVSASGEPRDFVLVSDAAIGNLPAVLPSYRQAVRTHPGNRATLYLLGDGTVCTRCLADDPRREQCLDCRASASTPLAALQAAGFRTVYLDPERQQAGGRGAR
jgi:hypothetical protein